MQLNHTYNPHVLGFKVGDLLTQRFLDYVFVLAEDSSFDQPKYSFDIRLTGDDSENPFSAEEMAQIHQYLTPLKELDDVGYKYAKVVDSPLYEIFAEAMQKDQGVALDKLDEIFQQANTAHVLFLSGKLHSYFLTEAEVKAFLIQVEPENQDTFQYVTMSYPEYFALHTIDSLSYSDDDRLQLSNAYIALPEGEQKEFLTFQLGKIDPTQEMDSLYFSYLMQNAFNLGSYALGSSPYGEQVMAADPILSRRDFAIDYFNQRISIAFNRGIDIRPLLRM